MTNFARGKYAKSISDRSGMEFPYSEMVREWNGSRVHISEFEPKQPQLELKVHAADPEALQNARVDRTEPTVAVLLNINSFKTGSASSSTITVTEINHGRASSDTVRFRNAISFDGISGTNINKAAGYTITKVDADTYTFSVDTDTATAGNVKGGGENASAGPVTISP
jgi:hypothetical protein|tara:strand:- start:1118 stop:1621 length:504 start_codon:yes stop_codon:yes gene_type:complete